MVASLSGNSATVRCLPSAERQHRYRTKIKVAGRQRVEAILPFEVAIKLDYLAEYSECTKTEAFGRLLMAAQEREGRPIPRYDAEGEPIPQERWYQGKSVTG